MTAVRRPPLLLLSGWLGVTLAAVTVAWFGVRPVAEQRIAEPPPVPRPELVAPPGEGRSTSGRAPIGTRATPSTRRPTSGQPRGPESSRRPSLPVPTPDVSLPTPTLPIPSPSPRTPSPTPSPSQSSPDDPLVREVRSTGGDAAFAYHQDGEVSLLDATPREGWEVAAYRMEPDWVVVEFERYGHRSTVHAYISTDQEACVDIIEEQT